MILLPTETCQSKTQGTQHKCLCSNIALENIQILTVCGKYTVAHGVPFVYFVPVLDSAICIRLCISNINLHVV